MATICWTTYTDPTSLINVGMEALAMQSNSVIYFFDLKTKAVNFYKGDNTQLGAGVAHLAGHSRFSLFAFTESILQPSIFIMRYPDFSKFHTIIGRHIFTYADLRFSEFDHLVALSGHPYYTIYVWNIRTHQLVVEYDTHKASANFSLTCSANNIPIIVQYSELLKETYVWEICTGTDNVQLHEISTIKLSYDNEYSKLFFFCFGEDGQLYSVNDYGNVYIAETTQFKRNLQFSLLSNEDKTTEPMEHCIFFHRAGLILKNRKMIYFIKKKSLQNWQIEWSIDILNVPMVKMAYNFNNEIYGVDQVGNIYMIETAAEEGKLVQQNNPANYLVRKFLLLKGVKEDSALVLTHKGELLLVDILRNNHLSKVHIANAETMASHNQLLFVAVGTSLGTVHFLSYEKLRAPVIIGMLDLETAKVKKICLMDTNCGVVDANQKLHILHCDYKRANFSYVSKSRKMSVLVMDFAIIDDNNLLLYISNKLKEPMTIKYIEELWICQYRRKTAAIKEFKYNLPHNYVDFTMPPITHKNAIEIFGIRYNDYVIDIYNVVNLSGLTLMTTIMTHHFSNINGLAGLKNLITWGVDSIIMHFRSHKKSTKSYIISRPLQLHYLPIVEEHVEDCLNGKYLMIHQSNGCLKCFRLPALSDNLRENVVVPDTSQTLEPHKVIIVKVHSVSKDLEVFVPTTAELKARAQVESLISDLKEVMRNLIDFDISVTGKVHGTFRKFCLNQSWLDGLNEQARFLFTIERNSLLESISDQSRIRDWIMHLITSDAVIIGSKIRSLFSKTFFENYSIRKPNPEHMAIFDIYRFYDMDAPEEEIVGDDDEEPIEEEVSGHKRSDKRFVKMDNMLDHLFDDAFMVSDKNIVSCNQMYNAMVKTKLILINSLKEEFNKKYNEVRQLKQELMDSIFGTNSALTKIYENMNIMLHLLKMETFQMPFLSIPEWMRDEVLERILTVDDSEIKAINRRKKKQTMSEHKSGRMLLWSIEFWIRALITMMDGVLEKLWEEEIKKDIPIPEFMIKKQDHEYNLEDQKQLREYNEKVRILGEDRRKYLRILTENEQKTLVFKTSLIMKCNQKVTEMATVKLNYDFAVKQEVLRLMSLRQTHHTRTHLRNRMRIMKFNESKINEYILKYSKLQTYWEKSVSDIKAKVENLVLRDKTLEKQFKGHYINSIPAHLTHEITKLFKKRPKMTQKSFNSTMVCMEVAARITPHHQKNRVEFPLPSECFEFLTAMDALDDASNVPNTLDSRHWDTFCKLRRQKLESELKIKGINYQLLDAQNALLFIVKDGSIHLKDARQELLTNMEATAMDYYEAVLNQKLQITLPMGQVEIGVGGSMDSMKDCILMNMSDINEVNHLIKTAGAKKLRAMQRVALFRRNVIFKEWEHKVVRANIDYLNYILKVIEKCKVTIEFRDVLRKWQNNKDRKKTTSVLGILERVVEQKIAAFRKNLERILDKIDTVRAQIDQMKSLNKQADKANDDIRISVAMAEVRRDYLGEERRTREQKERMDKIKAHRHLIETVRHDYAQILELSTILELQRLRTYPTLGPAPPDC